MAGWYNKVSDNLSNIIDCIDYYEGELLEAKKECYIKGNVERNSAALPGVTEHRFNQLQEIEAILEHLNIELRRERSKVFRKYFESYNRTLTSRDAEKFVDGEESVTIYNMLGQTVLTKAVISNGQSIDITSLAKGIYNVYFNNAKVSYKFIKE